MATPIVAETHPRSSSCAGSSHQRNIDLCVPTLLRVPRLFHPHLGPPGRTSSCELPDHMDQVNVTGVCALSRRAPTGAAATQTAEATANTAETIRPVLPRTVMSPTLTLLSCLVMLMKQDPPEHRWLNSTTEIPLYVVSAAPVTVAAQSVSLRAGQPALIRVTGSRRRFPPFRDDELNSPPFLDSATHRARIETARESPAGRGSHAAGGARNRRCATDRTGPFPGGQGDRDV